MGIWGESLALLNGKANRKPSKEIPNPSFRSGPRPCQCRQGPVLAGTIFLGAAPCLLCGHLRAPSLAVYESRPDPLYGRSIPFKYGYRRWTYDART
jgi:hypothetical protein